MEDIKDSGKQAGEDIALFKELIRAAEKAEGKILISICAYARPEEFPYLEQLKNTFSKLNPHIDVVIAGRKNLRELLPTHKVLFLQGGDTAAHKKFMADISVEKLQEGKTLIAGASSGGMLLCQHGYSENAGGVFAGKGIVDLAMIPHADSWPVERYLPEMHRAAAVAAPYNP